MATTRLSGADAAFLYLETEATPMHVGGLALVTPPRGLRSSFHEHFRRVFADRLRRVPAFARTLAQSVFAIDHPGWAEAGEIDLDVHVEGRRLPPPGTRAQLEALVAELHAERLDRARPLWRIAVIEGLEGGGAAIYAKVHHAAIGGGAGSEMARALFDLSPRPAPAGPAAPERARTLPERAALGLHDIAAELLRGQLDLLAALPQAAGQAADLVAPTLRGGPPLPRIVAPRTPFNRAVGPARAFAARSVPLAEAKEIAAAAGATLGDVVLAIAAGGLRAWLLRRHALPRGALAAFAPVALREAGGGVSDRVFGMICPLATDEADPLRRLALVKRDSRAARVEAGGGREIPPRDYTIFGAPALLPGLLRLFGANRLAGRAPSPVNLVISSTAGPPAPLWCAGAEVTALFPVSAPVHGAGLSIAVQSYRDALDFGITADAASVPDIEFMGDAVEAAHAELREAAISGRPAEAARAKPKPEPKPRAARSAPRRKPPARKPAETPEAASPAEAPAKKGRKAKAEGAGTAGAKPPEPRRKPRHAPARNAPRRDAPRRPGPKDDE